MLDRQSPSRSEVSHARLRARHEPTRQPDARAERRVVQPRRVVALALVLAGVVWALIRGLEFFGVGPVDLVYDVDQPPLLLMLVAAWLWLRSRVR